MDAAHLAHKAAKLRVGNVSIARSMGLRVFHQVLRDNEPWIFLVSLWQFTNAQPVNVPLLKAAQAKHLLVKQGFGLWNVVAWVPAVEVQGQQIVEHRPCAAVVYLLEERPEIGLVLLPSFIDCVDGIAPLVVAGGYDPLIVPAHVHCQTIKPWKGVNALGLN
jgi:hypothetical protein